MNTKKRILFTVYCLLLIWIILFKLSFSLQDFKELHGVSSLNLIPFYYKSAAGFQFTETFQNLLIFIPFGIYTKMLDYDNKKAILIGFVFSLSLEMCQLLFQIGATDITDLITNTSGTAIGVYLYKLFVKLFKTKRNADSILIVLSSVTTILFVSLLLLTILSN